MPIPEINTENIALYVAIISFASTIFGVIIGSVSSYYIAKRQFKSTVIATSRQAWIDSLRESVSEFQGILVTLNFFIDTMKVFDEEKQKEYKDVIQKTAYLRSKINLYLNVNDEIDHGKLSKLTKDALTCLAKKDLDQLDNTVTEINNITQRILKNEWEVVKKGE